MSYKHALDDILTEEQLDKLNSRIVETDDGTDQAGLDYEDLQYAMADVNYILQEFKQAIADASNAEDLRRMTYIRSVLEKAFDAYNNYGKRPSSTIMKDVGPLSDY